MILRQAKHLQPHDVIIINDSEKTVIAVTVAADYLTVALRSSSSSSSTSHIILHSQDLVSVTARPGDAQKTTGAFTPWLAEVSP